jgi:hypothetical protein
LGRSNRPQAVRSQRGSLTSPGRRSNRPRRSEQVFALCCISMLHYCIGSGGCALAQGSLHVCRGSSLCCSSFGLVVCALCLSMVFVLDVSSSCPFLRGPRLVLLQVILLFDFSLAFDRLLESLLVVSFLFLFSLVTKYVCCQCTHQGED